MRNAAIYSKPRITTWFEIAQCANLVYSPKKGYLVGSRWFRLTAFHDTPHFYVNMRFSNPLFFQGLGWKPYSIEEIGLRSENIKSYTGNWQLVRDLTFHWKRQRIFDKDVHIPIRVLKNGSQRLNPLGLKTWVLCINWNQQPEKYDNSSDFKADIYKKLPYWGFLLFNDNIWRDNPIGSKPWSVLEHFI